MQASFPTIYNRITFITRLVMSNESLTLEDIDSRWRDSVLCDGSAINRRQLLRDRERIIELFGIDIQPRKVNKNVYCYHVTNKDALNDGWHLKWAINTLAMAEILVGYSSLRSRISFEGYSHDPHLLPPILEAMKNNKKISIKYKRFDNVCKTHTVEPFFITDYQHRIYLIAQIDCKRSTCVFALDRILSVNLLDKKFKMPAGLTVDSYFEDCFGVYRSSNVQPVYITIRAYGDEMFYLASKPLHSSQRTLGKLDMTLGHCDFLLYLKPTNDFLGFILSRAERLEVISPLYLRQKMYNSLSLMIRRYADVTSSDSALR